MNEKLFEHYDEEIKAELSQYGEVKREDKDFGFVYTAGESEQDSALLVLSKDLTRAVAGYGQGSYACLVRLDQGYPIKLAFDIIKKDHDEVMKERGA